MKREEISKRLRRSLLGPSLLSQVVPASHRTILGALATALFLGLLLSCDTAWTSARPTLLAPFGASAMLVFFAAESPLNRPWNVVTGHVISAACAWALVRVLSDAPPLLLAALATVLAVALMLATASLHAPGGLTAWLIATAEPEVDLRAALTMALMGSIVLVCCRLLADLGIALCWRLRRHPKEVALASSRRRAAPTRSPPG